MRLAAYVQGDRLLAIVLNQGAAGKLSFPYDVGPWLPAAASVTMTHYDERGEVVATRQVPAAGALETPALQPLEMAIFEFVAR